jgi:hypothetical protein
MQDEATTQRQEQETSTLRDTKAMADVEVGSSLNMGERTVAKSYKVGPITLPAYRSPLAQTIIISFVCFLVVGEYPLSACKLHGHPG